VLHCFRPRAEGSKWAVRVKVELWANVHVGAQRHALLREDGVAETVKAEMTDRLGGNLPMLYNVLH